MVYEGSGGNVLYEYKGGLIDSSKGPILLFGNGTEDEKCGKRLQPSQRCDAVPDWSDRERLCGLGYAYRMAWPE